MLDVLGEYKKLVKELIALKSVSADSSKQGDLARTAKWLSIFLTNVGFKSQMFNDYGNPIVFASLEIDPSFETCLIYGHYDVQPAEKEDGWESDPFEVVERNNKLFGRGIMDDKGQFFVHMVTISNLVKEKKLKYNIKFIFEGNEETGSPFIEKFIQDKKDLLSCDFILISDGEMTRGKPTIELGNRGILNWKLTIKTSNSDIHSGIYGGAAPNSIHELSNFVHHLIDENNRIAIEGFYDSVDKIEEKYNIPFDLEEYKKNSGTKAILTEPEHDFFTQTGLRPAMTVTGIYGGHIKEGHKTSIPSTATAKINFRLVMSQDPYVVAEQVRKHVKKHLPNYVEYDLSFDEFAGPSKTDKNNKYVQKAVKVLEKVLKSKVHYRYVGGTEPVILYFQQLLAKPIVSVPFANEDGFMHGVNENFNIENIKKMMEFGNKFFGI